MKKQKYLLRALPVILLLLAGCSPARLLATAGAHDGYKLVSALSYGSTPRQKFDLFIPHAPASSACAIVFLYGGSWQNGDRADYHFAAQGLIKTGCAVAIVDYRLYPEVSYPAFVQDSAAAFVWLKNNAASYGINPSNIYLAGHSAGAYNVAMVALHPRFLKEAGGRTADIKGVIGLAGPYDFLPFTSKNIISLFSTAPDAETQPVNYVHKNAPPFLLLTGVDDTQVLPKNSENLAGRLTEKGAPVTHITYPDLGHVGIALSLSPLFEGKAPVLQDIAHFIRATESN